LYTLFISPTRETFCAHLILLDPISLVIFGEERKLGNFSLCNFLQPPVISYLVGKNIVFSKRITNFPSFTVMKCFKIKSFRSSKLTHECPCSVCTQRPCDGMIPRPRSPTNCV
jgi:hypothetical protein